jgi:hypothetical protein
LQQEQQTTRSGSVDSALDHGRGVGGEHRGSDAPGEVGGVGDVRAGEDTDDGVAGEDGSVGQGADGKCVGVS